MMDQTIVDARGQACPMPVVRARRAMAERTEAGACVRVLVDNAAACRNLEKMARGYGWAWETREAEPGCFEVTLTRAEARREGADGANGTAHDVSQVGRAADIGDAGTAAGAAPITAAGERVVAKSSAGAVAAFDHAAVASSDAAAVEPNTAVASSAGSAIGNAAAPSVVANDVVDAADAHAAASASPSGLVIAIGTRSMGRGDDDLGQLLLKGFVFSVAQLDEVPDAILLFNAGIELAMADSASRADLEDIARRGTRVLVCGTCVQFYGREADIAVGEITNMMDIVERMSRARRLIQL